MRYYLTRDTLIIRGSFHACSTGTNGGIRNVTSLLNHTVTSIPSVLHPDQTIEQIARITGLSPTSSFGLLTAVPMSRLCIFRINNLTVFITAGITHPDQDDQMTGTEPPESKVIPGTINIICCIAGGMSDQGLLDAIITVTEAKSLALTQLGHPFAGTVTDAVIIASEGEGVERYAGSATPLGHCIHKAVLFGLPLALEKSMHVATLPTGDPVFFIHSAIGGNRWIQWEQKGCPYYPCHFRGQQCELCYCPLYPCEDETLGEWTSGSQKRGRIWSCAPCTLNHQPAVVQHLRRNPEASHRELKALLRYQRDCQ